MEESTQIKLYAWGSGILITGILTGLFFLTRSNNLSVLILRALLFIGVGISLGKFFLDTKGDDTLYPILGLFSITLIVTVFPAFFLFLINERYNTPEIFHELEHFCLVVTLLFWPLQTITLIYGFQAEELTDRSEERREKERERQRETERKEGAKRERERWEREREEQETEKEQQKRIEQENKEKGKRRVRWEDNHSTMGA